MAYLGQWRLISLRSTPLFEQMCIAASILKASPLQPQNEIPSLVTEGLPEHRSLSQDSQPSLKSEQKFPRMNVQVGSKT